MRWRRYLVILGLCEFLIIMLSGYWGAYLRGGAGVKRLISWHAHPEILDENQRLLSWGLWVLETLFSWVQWLDGWLLFFPSWLVSNFWSEEVLLGLLWLGVGVIVSWMLVLRINWRFRLGVLFLAIWLMIPVEKMIQEGGNRLVLAAGWRGVMPWSDEYVWMWTDDDGKALGRKEFRYTWNQRSLTQEAYVLISCLGHYQLSINDQVVYHGPSFGVWPEVIIDEVSISDRIVLGENVIGVICEYSPEVMHEHPQYARGAMLVGGVVKDGWRRINLADWRWWRASEVPGLSLGPRVSRDAGYTERVRLGQRWESRPAAKVEFDEIQIRKRTLPLLTYADIEIHEDGQTWDLGRLLPGYLRVEFDLAAECEMEIVWGSHFEDGGLVRYMEQTDFLSVPAGKWSWQQFSRRTGRYVHIKHDNCIGNIQPSMKVVGMPFYLESPEYLDVRDKRIWELSYHTLKNDIQNHFEDSPERERAMYLGDARVVSQCLLEDQRNEGLVREMLRRFEDSQSENGAIPALTPSGKFMLLPDYVLQYPIWLAMVAERTGTVDADSLQVAERAMLWATQRTSENGLLANKLSEGWWVFIDWTEIDRSYQYITALQLWYLEALSSMSRLYVMEGDQTRADEYTGQAQQLKEQLMQLAYDEERGVFVDSFDGTDRTISASLVTNAMAGRNIELVEEIDLSYFKRDLFTKSAYSQTWVIEWMIRAAEYELALETMRGYWGAIIEDGGTGIYEIYSPGEKPQGSRSHAWGCGPVWLLPEIYEALGRGE